MPQYLLSELTNPGTNAYNAYDCALTLEINEVLSQLPEPGPIYNFSRALQAPVMEMMLRGIKINRPAVDSSITVLKQNLSTIEDILKKFVLAVWDKPWELNKKAEPTLPNSTKQLIDLFYNHLGIPIITKKVKGETKIPMDRDILERIQNSYFQAVPIISLILAHRDITGQLE